MFPALDVAHEMMARVVEGVRFVLENQHEQRLTNVLQPKDSTGPWSLSCLLHCLVEIRILYIG